MSWLRLFAGPAIACILVSAGACNDSEESIESDQPSVESPTQADELHMLAEELADAGNLHPAVPQYLPPGIGPEPSEVHAAVDTNVLVFFASGTLSPGVPAPRKLEIVQEDGANVILESPLVGLAGVEASVQSGTYSDDSVFYSLEYMYHGRMFFVVAEWLSPDGSLSEEMWNETRRVAESLLTDFDEQRLSSLD